MNTFLLHFPLYFDRIFSRQFTLHFRFLLENFTQDGFRSLFFSLALIRQVWFSFRFLSSLDWLMEHFSSMFRVSNLLWKRRVGVLSFVGKWNKRKWNTVASPFKAAASIQKSFFEYFSLCTKCILPKLFHLSIVKTDKIQ